jgi:cytochrome c-type biogenesis protein CcmF
MSSLGALGRPSLVAALVFCVVAIALFAVSAARRRPYLAESGRRFLALSAGFVTLATLSLLHALIAHDFSFLYVANYSSRSLSGVYTLAALWGGMEGSLLFWTLLLGIMSFLALSSARRWVGTAQLSRAGLVLAGVSIFFIILLVGPADPFASSTEIPADGRGLNPLLQSPGMLVHPPLLYTGFVGFSIPFAFAMAALSTARLDSSWFAFTRRWTLFAWSALSIGIVLGGAWAYTELGWGGYWAWDPVENASFMPWLTGTAYLHSVVIQERRRMFKVWNVVLILLTYVLAVFGTFLTRSGILSSIHTFTEGPIGKWFLPFLGAMLLGGLGVIVMQHGRLRAENRLESAISRESAFLLNNVLFVCAAFTVLWGTLYPIIAEALTGVRLSVGPPFFNSVFVPVGLALLLLAGIGPLVSWRRMSAKALVIAARPPVAAAVLAVVGLLVFGVSSAGVIAAAALCAFTAAAVIVEFIRGSRIHRRQGIRLPSALLQTLRRNRRRYGGYIVHLGIVLIVLGFAGAAFKTERHVEMGVGDTTRVGEYRLAYESLDRDITAEKRVFKARIDVSREGDHVETLFPQRNFHSAQGQWQSEVAIRSTPVEDLYLVITSFDPDGTASVRAFINPLTWWVWVGAAVMLAGIVVIISGGAVQPNLASQASPVARVAVATR